MNLTNHFSVELYIPNSYHMKDAQPDTNFITDNLIAKNTSVMWKTDLLGQYLLTNTAGELTALETKVVLPASKTIVALLFSALWCPPCEQFLKDLIVFYYKIKAKSSDFEIVLISSDIDDKQFQKCE
jgi:thiol-disulfide isomerase/thioredoxin